MASCNNMQTKMKTIVVKGSDYSVLNVRTMENTTIKDVNVVLVYPSGYTSKIQTSLHQLITVTETIDSFVYCDKKVFDYINISHLNLIESYEG